MKSSTDLLTENDFSPVKFNKIWSVSFFSLITAVDVIFGKTSLLSRDNTALVAVD